jgi:hypothetical protein
MGSKVESLTVQGLKDGGAYPMRVNAFLQSQPPEIRRGDIILSRSPTMSSWLIRKATGGYFSHAALMFLVPQPEDGYENAFLLESTSAGVALANLQSYVGGRHPHADIAILRLEGEGFDEGYFKKVRGLMLDHVKAGYDYGRVLNLGLSLNFGARLWWSKLSKGGQDSMREAIRRTRKRIVKWVPPQFICSGFIQYGFVEAMRREGRPASAVIFKNSVSEFDRDGILAVTPEDVATSPRLTWKYVIRRGWVYEVKSYAEARKIISSARR